MAIYQILLQAWYQETPKKTYTETCKDWEFESIEKAINFLNDNIEIILDRYPVEGISIIIIKR